VLIREATNTNNIVFGFTRPWLDSMIYYTLSEHANQYTTDVVLNIFKGKLYLVDWSLNEVNRFMGKNMFVSGEIEVKMVHMVKF